MKNLILVSMLVFSLKLSAYPTKPDPVKTFPTYCTQENPDFKTIKYGDVAICNRDVTTALKKKIYDSYGIPPVERVQYTIDHLVPLSLGGSNDKTNLWPQHRDISTSKLEYDVYMKLENGEIEYKEAVETILNKKLN